MPEQSCLKELNRLVIWSFSDAQRQNQFGTEDILSV